LGSVYDPSLLGRWTLCGMSGTQRRAFELPLRKRRMCSINSWLRCNLCAERWEAERTLDTGLV
jgi:hypothetical protein